MHQVADWLQKLGLGQYAQRFVENDISFVILPDLTDQDLEKVGVASLGHRRLLLRAIAELKSVDKTSPAPDAAASTPPAAAKIDIAERRQVTVMFSDLVGSTALSARMDPEDLREVISAYQKCVAETVVRFGGFVAKYMGDGVLVYFGYPRAHEDDAERAVRAGLGLIAAVTALKLPVSLQTRVGIATGLVVVGDLIGSGEAQERDTDSAFYPIIGQMERAAGLAHDDTPQARLDKLDALLAQTSTSKQDAVLFADLLSLPNDGRYPALELTPQQRRQKTLEALTAQLGELASRHPVLMIFEDVHWIDPTTLEALNRTVDRIKSFPVLLILTFRPDFDAPWMGQSRVTSLTLNRLGEGETAAIIARLAGNKELSANVMAEIVERTDGIPLFVEEMTKAVLEAEGEGEAQRTAAAIPSPAQAVPASLHASLMARLDRLGSVKEVAQIGAAIGREFAHTLLAAVVHEPEAELGSALDRLVAAGLLFRQGVPPHASYLFKHALVQDAAYGTLLRGPRQALHARIAAAIETQMPERVEREPELLAYHYAEAGQPDEAAGYWLAAGRLAARRSANSEAAAHLTRGIAGVRGLQETMERNRQELALQLALGPALLSSRGFGDAEASAGYQRAAELARRLGDDRDRFAATWGLWISIRATSASDHMRLRLQYLGEMVEAAERTGDPELQLSDFQRKEAAARRGNGETLAQIARSYAVSVSMISRL